MHLAFMYEVKRNWILIAVKIDLERVKNVHLVKEFILFDLLEEQIQSALILLGIFSTTYLGNLATPYRPVQLMAVACKEVKNHRA